MQKYYRTIVWLIVIIIALSLIVIIFSGSGQMQNTSPVITATTTSSAEASLMVVTQSDNNTTVHLAQGEQFVINLGALHWTLVFSPENIIGRVLNTPDNTGQGIYEGLHAGTTTLHGTGAPICNPGQACPDFMEAMTITFVVE
ncbi:MAG TPA: hypothetical protein VMR73_01260 [Candidatus Paceibacterota bacterium]|nr:hypothetical protein [Candidatus Paceibacterota bacterium]